MTEQSLSSETEVNSIDKFTNHNCGHKVNNSVETKGIERGGGEQHKKQKIKWSETTQKKENTNTTKNEN